MSALIGAANVTQQPPAPSPAPAAAAAASATGPQQVSGVHLGGIVNLSKLEGILNSLVAKMESQQLSIQKLSEDIRVRSTIRSVEIVQRRLEEALDSVEKRFASIEERITRNEAPLTIIPTHSRRIKVLEEKLDEKAEIGELREFKEQFARVVHTSVDELQRQKASVEVVSSLEDSQHRLYKEVVALQKGLADKVGFGEISLLNAAADKMRSLQDFQREISPRIEQVELELKDTRRVLDEKEDKANFVIRMRTIHERLMAKADGVWINETIIDPLRSLQKTMSQLGENQEILQKELDTQRSITDKVTRLHDRVAETQTEAGKIQSAFGLILDQLESKMDVKEANALTTNESVRMESLMRQIQQHYDDHNKLQAAYVADCRQQIATIKAYQAAVDKKVAVALRFVDWFTDVKLKEAPL